MDTPRLIQHACVIVQVLVPPLSPLPHGGRFPFQLPEGQTSCKLVRAVAVCLSFSRGRPRPLLRHVPDPSLPSPPHAQDLVEIDESKTVLNELASLSLKNIEKNNLLFTVQLDKVCGAPSLDPRARRPHQPRTLFFFLPPHPIPTSSSAHPPWPQDGECRATLKTADGAISTTVDISSA